MDIKQLKTSRPKLRYHEVMEVVSNGINNGQYAPGEKLPGMKDISRQLGMNFLTVRKAMTELAEKGLVEIRHGAGTFVVKRSVGQKTKNVKLGLACRSYMLHTDKHHPALGAYLAGAHQRCKPPEFILQPLFYDKHRFVEELGQIILSEKLSGVVVFGGNMKDADYKFLQKNNIHVVNCACGPRDDKWLMTVTMLKSNALRQAIEHLRLLGHKRIAFTSYVNVAKFENINSKYAQLAFEHRLGAPEELTVLVRNSEGEVCWEDCEKLFAIDPMPTAVITNDGFLADAILDGCERRSIKIPDQLSIVSLQDSKPEGHRIPLTAINDAAALTDNAYKACDLLVRRIAGKSIETTDIVLESKLVVKASSGPAVTGISPEGDKK